MTALEYGGEGLYASSTAFESSRIDGATLHVPESAIAAYKDTDPWSGFKSFVAAADDVAEDEIPEVLKCAKPTITYKDGKVSFACDTEGVEFVSTVTASDAKAHFVGSEITIGNTYTISVYATKPGYDDSAVAELEIVGAGGKLGDLNSDGNVNAADVTKLVNIIMGRK